MSRRGFIGTVVAVALYLLTASGIIKPLLACRRHLVCGSRQKLLCDCSHFPAEAAMGYTNTINSGPGPIGTALCMGFDGTRGDDGSYCVTVNYQSDQASVSGITYMTPTGAIRHFQVHENRWHGGLFGKMPDAEYVDEAEFSAAV